MSNYKETLNLPVTAFPMKANLPVREPEMLAHWLSINLYDAVRLRCEGRPKFILHDGPPYANGNIHIGHAVNKILKDIVLKSKTLSGWNAPYVPGWDCHGLPIELETEKKHGKVGEKGLTPAAFRAACRAYAEKQVDIQRTSFKRLGVLGDWDHPYRTMDPAYEADIVRAFADMVESGVVIRGQKPVYWCLACHSSLAEAEVEYQEKNSSALDVAFNVVDPESVWSLLKIKGPAPKKIVLPIWTTTPWTLPANQAVAVNAAARYALVRFTQKEHIHYLIIAQDLIEKTLQRILGSDVIPDSEVLVTFDGSLIGSTTQERAFVYVQHPLENRTVPVLCGDHVTTDAGTGAVHIAPAHGEDDYLLGKKAGLEIKTPIVDGKFYAPEQAWHGDIIRDAEPKIIEALKVANQLLASHALRHSYPHCWRHKIPLIFLATPQRFVSMNAQDFRERALAAIDHVSWMPDWGKARIEGMVRDRPDWCVSRQRIWGVPLCLVVHSETGELHSDMPSLMRKIAQHIEKEGLEFWFKQGDADGKTIWSSEMRDLLGDQCDQYHAMFDVLDVWFDSGVSHAAVLRRRPELGFPADLYLEGSDQHRGWFQSSLLSSVALNDVASYRTVLTHGFTVDAKGRKMSKSLGNVIAPEKVIEKLGADVLRLWISSADYRGEMTVSDEILQRVSDVYRRIRNTARFLLANIFDFDPVKNNVSWAQLPKLDQHVLRTTYRLQKEIQNDFETYQFHLVYQKIQQFCSVDLGGFYLDIIKDRQYTCATDGIARRAAQTTLYHLLHALVRFITPILSFTAEEIWRAMPGRADEDISVFLTQWYDQWPVEAMQSDDSTLDWSSIMQVREAVNGALEVARSENKIGSGLAASVTIKTGEPYYDALHVLGAELRFVLIVSEVIIERDVTPSALTIHVQAAETLKCARCWHHVVDVGTHAEHPEICGRCVMNLGDVGETRHFA